MAQVDSGGASRQRTAARIARLRGEEESSDEDSDKDEDERKAKASMAVVVPDYSVFFQVLLFLFSLILLLLVVNLFYLQQILIQR